jgi:uncharacterized membrane protein YvlD (DUF360 family)
VAAAPADQLVVAAAAAFALGIVNLLIRPLILLLALPLGFIATFIIGLFANAFTLLITARLLPFFRVEGFLAALGGGLALAAVNTLLTGVITLDDEGSFYEGIVERIARLQTFRGAAEPGRGLVMLEIDGLSYWHMKHALEAGLLPALTQMMRDEGYVLSRVDCGLPSQTSACQAGILFGDNYDIPAFRWFDKEQGKLFVSGADAPAINARYARGHGLLRGGSSINNMLNGDAEKSIFTLADLRSGSRAEQIRRAQDIYLLVANPYFLMRTIVLMLGDAALEIAQFLRARLRNVRPRLDRLKHVYPLVRAATTVLMRDIAAYLTVLDILRGAPAIYVTWPGYDEVAHHSGPWSRDAFGVLKKYDRVIRRVRAFIQRKAPRPYDLIVLSDHGQSFGATFKQRYGLSLKEFIEQQAPGGAIVHQRIGGDTGVIALSAVSGELENIQQQGLTGRVGGAMVKRGQQAAQRAIRRHSPADGHPGVLPAAQVVAFGSGNLAHVYFDLAPRRITLAELEAAYPGMVAALVAHEGIGLVAGYDAAGGPLVLGKGGQRDLRTGAVIGEDPLTAYGNAELRAWQIGRVMEFPHAGDLMVISTVYPDGTVAALEELIGSHGGLGGEQTDAFLFHPGDMAVGETRCSTDVFHILNARRSLPAETPRRPATTPTAPPQPRPWDIVNLVEGVIRQPSLWLGRGLRCLLLERRAFAEVSADPRMTGPAVVLAGAGLAAIAFFGSTGWSVLTWLEQIGVWLTAVLMIFGAGRLLGGHATYTSALRGLGFAATAHLLNLAALIPPLEPLAPAITFAAAFVATWMAAAEAHGLRGWRTLLLPAAGVALFVVGVAVSAILFAGAELTLTTLGRNLGLLP